MHGNMVTEVLEWRCIAMKGELDNVVADYGDDRWRDKSVAGGRR